MSRAEQDAFIETVNAHFSDPRELAAEGRPHRIAKGEVLDALGLHFRRLGRRIYLADDLAVLYPGEECFVPDILAVLDVEQPDEDDREAWVVAREGRGPDLVLEVLHSGNRHKDLVRNVAWFARLGISEYFVYDRRNEQVLGWRLAVEGAPYTRLPLREGRISSRVLGLELGVVAGHLRFFVGAACIEGTNALLRQLAGMVDAVTARADAAERREADAELRGLRSALLALLSARRLEPGPAQMARIQGCDDPAALTAWVGRAAVAATIADMFAPDTPNGGG
jgi:Uma2 family endonuclease